MLSALGLLSFGCGNNERATPADFVEDYEPSPSLVSDAIEVEAAAEKLYEEAEHLESEYLPPPTDYCNSPAPLRVREAERVLLASHDARARERAAAAINPLRSAIEACAMGDTELTKMHLASYKEKRYLLALRIEALLRQIPSP